MNAVESMTVRHRVVAGSSLAWKLWIGLALGLPNAVSSNPLADLDPLLAVA
jgi:hypothetical protein